MSCEGHWMYILEIRFCSAVSESQLLEGVVVLFRSIHYGSNVTNSIDIGRQTYLHELGQWSNVTNC
jgi:hypothetical protein